jgi:hypothetical protein
MNQNCPCQFQDFHEKNYRKGLMFGVSLYTVHLFFFNHILLTLVYCPWQAARSPYFSLQNDYEESRDSSVGIALGYGLENWGLGFNSWQGLGIFFFTIMSRTALGPTQPPIQWVPGALSLGVKRLVCEADHSPPSSAKVKEWVELYLYSPNTPSWRGA